MFLAFVELGSGRMAADQAVHFSGNVRFSNGTYIGQRPWLKEATGHRIFEFGLNSLEGQIF